MYQSSNKFVRYLDEFYDKPVLSKFDYTGLMGTINRNYTDRYGWAPVANINFDKKLQSIVLPYNRAKTDTHIDMSNTCIDETNRHVDEVTKLKKVNIDTDVKCLNDLITIIDAHPYEANTQYNIDLKSLHNIKSELILLNNMIGMEGIKSSVTNQLLYFIQNLDTDVHGNSDFKHTVICGPPGTGKTEIAKLIGQMYSKVGILTKNIFKKVTRNDLVAGYLGQTAIKTSKIITECIGGVLFIDEAYSLAAPDNHDSFAKECLDTLCESLSDHKNDLMVIIAGYENDLNETFFKVNRGLESRFIWKFCMDPYTANELMRIFMKKVTDNGWQMNIDDTTLIGWFKRNHKQFVHYGRDMEQLFTYVKIYHSRRIYGKANDLRKKITIDDLTNAFEIFESTKKKDIPTYLQNIYV